MDLSEGDFLYQGEQELFLVVVDETDDTYRLAAHGWRDIDKKRLDEYVESEHMSIYKGEDVIREVKRDGDSEMEDRISQLQRMLFDTYSKRTFTEEGPVEDFILDDTDDRE